MSRAEGRSCSSQVERYVSSNACVGAELVGRSERLRAERVIGVEGGG